MAAAANAVETRAQNRIESKLFAPAENPPLTTNMFAAVQQNYISSPESGQTRMENSPTSVISEASFIQHTSADLPMTAGIRTINGVVGHILKDSITISCRLPSGQWDLRLPPALVPDELQNFGLPVRISLDTTGGIRRPIVTARPIEPQAKLPGQEDVEDWLNKL